MSLMVMFFEMYRADTIARASCEQVKTPSVWNNEVSHFRSLRFPELVVSVPTIAPDVYYFGLITKL